MNTGIVRFDSIVFIAGDAKILSTQDGVVNGLHRLNVSGEKHRRTRDHRRVRIAAAREHHHDNLW